MLLHGFYFSFIFYYFPHSRSSRQLIRVCKLFVKYYYPFLWPFPSLFCPICGRGIGERVQGYVTYLMLVLQEWRSRCIVDRFLWRRVMAFFFLWAIRQIVSKLSREKARGISLILTGDGFIYIHIYVMGIDNKKIWKRIEEGYLLFSNECGVFDNIVKMLALELIDWKTDWMCAGKWTRFGMFLGHSTNVDETSSHRKAVFQILNGDIPFSLKVLFVWSCFIFLTTKSWKFC